MPWFKIDDAFHCHPKILAAGNAATGLFVRLGSYCSQQLTDGFVPYVIVKSYGKPSEIKTLVGMELIEEVGGGYVIPDFLEFNPSAEKVREERAKTAERVRRWRESHGSGNGVTESETSRKLGADVPVTERPTQSNNRVTLRKLAPVDNHGTPGQGANDGECNGVTNGAPTRPDPTRPLSLTSCTDSPLLRTVADGLGISPAHTRIGGSEEP